MEALKFEIPQRVIDCVHSKSDGAPCPQKESLGEKVVRGTFNE